MSKHGQKMSDAWQKAETARREKLGKTVEAPKPELKAVTEKESPVSTFNFSNGIRE
jgi:hypothetical protein